MAPWCTPKTARGNVEFFLSFFTTPVAALLLVLLVFQLQLGLLHASFATCSIWHPSPLPLLCCRYLPIQGSPEWGKVGNHCSRIGGLMLHLLPSSHSCRTLRECPTIIPVPSTGPKFLHQLPPLNPFSPSFYNPQVHQVLFDRSIPKC